MSVVKLTTDFDPKAIFYFNNMKECEDFKSVFNEHSCNIIWNEPIKILQVFRLSISDLITLKDDPKERAWRALQWGFSIMEG